MYEYQNGTRQSNEYRDGYNAYLSGLKKNDNPYSRSGDQAWSVWADDWDLGWDAAAWDD